MIAVKACLKDSLANPTQLIQACKRVCAGKTPIVAVYADQRDGLSVRLELIA